MGGFAVYKNLDLFIFIFFYFFCLFVVTVLAVMSAKAISEQTGKEFLYKYICTTAAVQNRFCCATVTADTVWDRLTQDHPWLLTEVSICLGFQFCNCIVFSVIYLSVPPCRGWLWSQISWSNAGGSWDWWQLTWTLRVSRNGWNHIWWPKSQ